MQNSMYTHLITHGTTVMFINLPQVRNSVNLLLTGIRALIDTKLDKTGNAVSATRLKEPFDLVVDGEDFTGHAVVQGDADSTLTLQLTDTGVAPGTYMKLTVDGKGRIVDAHPLLESDIPTLSIDKTTGLREDLDSRFKKTGGVVSGPVLISAPLTVETLQYVNCYAEKYAQSYDPLNGLQVGEYQELLTIASTGWFMSFVLHGKVTVQTDKEVQVLRFTCSVVNEDLPEMTWQAGYTEELMGDTEFVRPVIFSKNTEPGSFILALKQVSGLSKIINVEVTVDNHRPFKTAVFNTTRSSKSTTPPVDHIEHDIPRLSQLKNGVLTYSGSLITDNLQGNATTATRLQTPRTINNVSFDGSSDIVVYDNTKVAKVEGKGLSTHDFTETLLTKLNGIEENATGDMTAAELLALLKTVDGVGSGLDAEFLGGKAAADFLGKTDTALSAQRLSTARTINGVPFDGSENIHVRRIVGLQEVHVPVTANELDLSAGNLFSKVLTGPTTFTVVGIAEAGAVSSFTLELTNGGDYAIAWWSGIRWAGGTGPSLTPAGTDVLGFYTYDGGATWVGTTVAKDIR